MGLVALVQLLLSYGLSNSCAWLGWAARQKSMMAQLSPFELFLSKSCSSCYDYNVVWGGLEGVCATVSIEVEREEWDKGKKLYLSDMPLLLYVKLSSTYYSPFRWLWDAMSLRKLGIMVEYRAYQQTTSPNHFLKDLPISLFKNK